MSKGLAYGQREGCKTKCDLKRVLSVLKWPSRADPCQPVYQLILVIMQGTTKIRSMKERKK